MAKILQFPQPQGKFAASIDLFLEPDGSVLARLRDMDSSLIESMDGEPFDKMLKLALWTQQGAENLAEQADALRPA